MHSLWLVDEVDLTCARVAEDEAGQVVGVVHPEHVPLRGYLQLRRSHAVARGVLLDWAEGHLGHAGGDPPRARLGLYIDDADPELQALVAARGLLPLG
jgi:hypothetical protein